MSNPLIANFVETLESRYPTDEVGMTMSQWMEANTRHNGRPFTTNEYPFQKAILDDTSPQMACIKCSQVGLTEIEVRKALGMCARNPGFVGIFSLPTTDLFKKVSQTRIDPLIDSHKVFKDPDDRSIVQSVATKQIKRSFLHVVNASESSATSTSADALFIDEVDLSDQSVLALFSSRLQNSDWKIKHEFSTPTYTGYGIDARYKISDQHEFMIQCDRCNHHQVPTFHPRFVRVPGLSGDLKFEDITDDLFNSGRVRFDEAAVVCEKCSAPLDLKTGKREWVPKFPGRRVRGYRVRPFSTARISPLYVLEQMLDYRRREFIRGWHNTVMGEPFIDGKSQLSIEAIKAVLGAPVIGSPPDKDLPTFVGIDVGQICHLMQGVPTPAGIRIFACEQVHVDNIVTRVGEIADERNLVAGAVDRHPYEPTAGAIMEKTGGRIVPVEYRGTREINPVFDKTVEEEVISHFQADRTRMIDAAAKAVRSGKVRIEGYGEFAQMIEDHLRDMVREEEPEKPAVWKKLNGNDHFFHALGFLILATRLPDVIAVASKIDHRSHVAIGGVDMLQFPGLMSSGFRPVLL